jgi:hypothetical protein
VRKYAFLAAAALLLGCSKDIQTKEALKQGVVEYLNARTPQTGLDVNLMTVDISGMSFEKDHARATVVFRPKGSTEGPGMTMNYAFDRQGDKWVVKGSQSSPGGGNPHGAGGTLPAPGSDDTSGAKTLPPGHPPVSQPKQ